MPIPCTPTPWARGGPLLVLLALAAGCDVSLGEAKTPPGKEDDARVLVRLGEFVRQDISRKLPVAADLEAVREADVFPEIQGIVAEVVRSEGDRVSRDDPVVHLVDEELALTVRNKQILWEQSKTKIEQSRLALKESESQLEQKKLLVAEAESEYRRLTQLSKGESGIISEEELETKQYERGRLAFERQGLELQVEKNRLATTEAEQSTELADVDLRTAQLNLSRTVIRSPIDGAISYLDLKPGEKVDVATLIFQVVDVSKLRARLHVPQRELTSLAVGQRVLIRSDSFGDEAFEGRLQVINPVIDKDNGTVSVIVEVEDGQSRLRPGMFVSGEIVLETVKDALLVSKKAVGYEDKQPIIFLVHDGVARRYTLAPGYSDKDHIEVKGLTASDGQSADPSSGRLVLVGHNNLKEGSLVEVEAAGP